MDRRIVCDIRKFYEIHISWFIELCGGIVTAIHVCVVCGHFYAAEAEMSHCDRLYDPQNLKYLLSSPLQQKIANPWHTAYRFY